MHSIRGAAAAAFAVLCAAAPAALAHEGNPNFRSEVSAIAPALPGLEANVLKHDDRIELVYDGERSLVVEGYRDEPYLRFGPGGLVEVNRRSPAAYLNADRFAKVELPAPADHRAPPSWAPVAGPFSASTELGPARLDVTVDPASSGANEIHLYFFHARDGSQWDRAKELTLQLRLPSRDIGPLEPRLDKAGPGHYVARRALIAPGRRVAAPGRRARVRLRGAPAP